MRIKGNGKGKQCVARAVTTARILLGYKTALPRGFPKTGPIQTLLVVRDAHKWFPRHTVQTWSSEEWGAGAVGYCGEHFVAENINEKHLIMFDYYIDADKGSHFVIGHPCLYEGMKTSVIISISLDGKNGG